MYTALLECVTAPGQDGMRFALFLFKFTVLAIGCLDVTCCVIGHFQASSTRKTPR
jgi:hypothetical protein